MISVKGLFDAVEAAKSRHDALKEYLNSQKETIAEQRHLDAGSAESVYWNYGYCLALKDIIMLIDKTILVEGDESKKH
jgi:hypothetical protein